VIRKNYARLVATTFRRIPCNMCGDRRYVTLPVDHDGRCMFQEESGVVSYRDNYPCPSCHPEEWRSPSKVNT
jgi:hypothetical protein